MLLHFRGLRYVKNYLRTVLVGCLLCNSDTHGPVTFLHTAKKPSRRYHPTISDRSDTNHRRSKDSKLLSPQSQACKSSVFQCCKNGRQNGASSVLDNDYLQRSGHEKNNGIVDTLKISQQIQICSIYIRINIRFIVFSLTWLGDLQSLRCSSTFAWLQSLETWQINRYAIIICQFLKSKLTFKQLLHLSPKSCRYQDAYKGTLPLKNRGPSREGPWISLDNYSISGYDIKIIWLLRWRRLTFKVCWLWFVISTHEQPAVSFRNGGVDQICKWQETEVSTWSSD